MANKRITVKINHPNPLFERWLTEWLHDAKEKNLKSQYTFSKALTWLRKYPLPLETGRDCYILKGFGDKLCRMLDDKLKEHKKNPTKHPVQLKTDISKVSSPDKHPAVPAQLTTNISKSSSPDTKYIPNYGTGAYGILVTLYQQSLKDDYTGYMTKNEIIRLGQPIVNKSFTKPPPNSRYTAWSSMSTLITKQLIHKEGNPPRFSLTNAGLTLAKKLYDIENNKNPKTVNIVEEQIFPSTSKEKTITHQEDIVFSPNSFDIILYVDTAETRGFLNAEGDPLLTTLKHLEVNFEVKHLNVGDYLCICRHKETKEELVLPYIVERKRMDDFASSIKDGRYYEQKFRLRSSKIPNIVYLIESYGSNQNVGLPFSSLMQAATNTAVHDGFSVRFTKNLQETAQYLKLLTNALQEQFLPKTIFASCKESIPESNQISNDIIFLMRFKDFNRDSIKSKHKSVRGTFIKILLQIKGMSFDRAFAIIDKYPTPAILFKAYNDITETAGEALLADLRTKNGLKVGPKLSKIVYQFFQSDTL